MSNSSDIIALVDKKIEDAEQCQTFSQEQISLLASSKEPHKGAIEALDTLMFDETNAINNAINDVGAAYQSRVDAGCRSDLLWRVVGWTPPDGVDPEEFELECIRVQAGGYEQKSDTGIGSVFAYVQPNGSSGITSTVHLTNKVGLASDNYHGLKLFQEPYSHSVSDTYVTSGVGTCGFGTNTIYYMSPLPEGSIGGDNTPPIGIKTGMLIQASQSLILPVGAHSITGVSTVFINMQRIDSGIGTNASLINTLTLSTSTIGIASAPQPDGTYVTFTISKDPSGIGITNWGVNWDDDEPHTPQTILMMDSSSIGIGTSIAYDNSGEPNLARTWNQFLLGYPDPDDTETNVTRPEVGAGKSHYLVGFGSFPVSGGSPATVGQRKTGVATAELTNGSLYDDVTTSCTTQQANLVSAISTRDTLESALAASMSTFNARLALSNDIREDKNEIDISIWGYRSQIGKADSDLDKQNAFKGVLNDTAFLDEINGV